MTIRPRTPADVPALAAILARDHEATGYPYVLPDDPAAWIATPSDLVAFVAAAAADDAGDSRPAGHVSVGAATTTDHGAGTVLHDAWSAAHGRPVEDCAVVGRLAAAARARPAGRVIEL